MLQTIKRILPESVKKLLRAVKQKTYDQWYKKRLFKRMQVKHAELLQQIKGKEKIKVVFLAIHKSVWKVDPVFQKMLKDPFFEPVILVCPYTPYGEERMWQDMQEAYEYFDQKEYPVISSYNKKEKRWIKLSEIGTDIVFFTNPHNLTLKEYYEDAYLNYLSCYVPYHHEVVTNLEQFNQYFHVSQWKIFASHDVSLKIFKKHSPTKGSNVIVTGFPAMEDLLIKKRNNSYDNIWKNNDDRLKIIWAPHHSVELNQNVPYSNFLKHAELFTKLADKYKNEIVWSFKPHPILKAKLYEHLDWGVEKTDSYYTYWSSNEYSQLDEGEYTDLFCSSDAMIHDSGSFLAEYLYIKKPVLYNLSALNQGQHYSDFGKDALNSCTTAQSDDDIISFIKNLNVKNDIKKEHTEFIQRYVTPYFDNHSPSDVILNELKSPLTATYREV